MTCLVILLEAKNTQNPSVKTLVHLSLLLTFDIIILFTNNKISNNQRKSNHATALHHDQRNQQRPHTTPAASSPGWVISEPSPFLNHPTSPPHLPQEHHPPLHHRILCKSSHHRNRPRIHCPNIHHDWWSHRPYHRSIYSLSSCHHRDESIESVRWTQEERGKLRVICPASELIVLTVIRVD